jgi:hypothetical protein
MDLKVIQKWFHRSMFIERHNSFYERVFWIEVSIHLQASKETSFKVLHLFCLPVLKVILECPLSFSLFM